jgi:flagellar biosynthesis/type III secretory pathway protein FliH
LSDPRQAPRRHEWMPNRMFDPATNPFAIQNLLKKEKKEDTPFLLKRDERPVFGYSDNALLNESTIQPEADFQFDELLDQPIMSSPGFQSEVDEQFPAVSVPETPSADVEDSPAISAESTEETVQKNSLNLASDDSLTASHTLEADSTNDLVTEASLEVTENLAATSDTDSTDVTEMADANAEAQAHDTSADQDAPAQESAIDAAADDVADSQESQPDVALADATSDEHHAQIEAEQSAEQSSSAAESSDEVSSTEIELNAGVSQPEPEASPTLNNEAVNQLIETAREEARIEAHAAGFQEGLEAGLEQAKTEMQAAVDEKLAVIDQMIKGLHQLERDPNTLFEPMKKLAMHLAEQLVRGELTQSAQVIARLVDNCLRELAASGEKAVIVHLNPEDLEQYKPLIAQFGDSMVLRPDALLSRGSVRATLDGSVVEDLIDRRTKGLSKSLAQPVASSWRPALATPSLKPKENMAPKPATTINPNPAVTVTATTDAQDEMDQQESDHDDDLMVDELSEGHIDDTQADRNDETHS